MSSNSTSEPMAYNMRPHALRHHYRMEWRNKKNRHILEIARALLLAAHAPRQYWTDAVCTTVYFLNRLPSRVLNFNTPL